MDWTYFGLEKSNDHLKFFNKVYEHNKNKLYNVNGSCLSRNKIKKYIKIYDNIPGAKELLNFIFENILQVNFTEFLEALRKYVEAVCKDCESTISASSSTNQITFNVILIAKSPKKINQLHNTNFFTAMLVKKILDERNKSVAKFEIYGIAESVKEFEDIIGESINIENIIGILPNDCEHSGKELGKELYCDVYSLKDEENMPPQISLVKVSRKLYVVIPFINNYARYNLIIYEGYMNHQKTQNNDNSVNNIIFLSDCINYTESFMQICVKKDFNIIEKGLYFIGDGSNLVGETKYICKSILGLPISGSMIYFHHHMSSNDSLYSFLNLQKEQLYNNHNVNKKDATEFFKNLKNKELGKNILTPILNQIDNGNYDAVKTHISKQINDKRIEKFKYGSNFLKVDIYIGVKYFAMASFKPLFKDLHENIDVEKNIINLDFSNIQLYKKTELFKLPPAKGGYEKYIAVKKQYNELKKNLNKK